MHLDIRIRPKFDSQFEKQALVSFGDLKMVRTSCTAVTAPCHLHVPKCSHTLSPALPIWRPKPTKTSFKFQHIFGVESLHQIFCKILFALSISQ
jgi:hypothetical protein